MFPGITPSDTTLLQGYQWLRIGGAGNLVLKGSDSGAVATAAIAVTAGEYVPFGAGYVMAATTATGIQGFA
jgi:hypothetical protein